MTPMTPDDNRRTAAFAFLARARMRPCEPVSAETIANVTVAGPALPCRAAISRATGPRLV